MSLKIKQGVEPIGTEHHAPGRVVGSNIEGAGNIYYKVHSVTGTNQFVPFGDEPLVWLRLNRKTGHDAPMACHLPLSLFVEFFEPTSEADVFWEQVKTTDKRTANAKEIGLPQFNNE